MKRKMNGQNEGEPMNTIKIRQWTHAILDGVKEQSKRVLKSSVSFDEVIYNGISWRGAAHVTELNGELAFKICFVEFHNHMAHFEVGSYPIESYDDPIYVSHMIEADKVVIPVESLRVVFTYPLSHVVEKTFTKKEGFSRRDILKIVGKGYKEIYEEEKASMTAMEPSSFPGNRGKSNGVHGIWGHVLGDLVLEGLVFETKTSIVRLIIGS